MRYEKYDAYGEVLPDAARGRRETGRTASMVLARVGQTVFWLLVVVIVSFRIICYPSLPAFEVGSASDVSEAVRR
jgi:hypothetical protein